MPLSSNISFNYVMKTFGVYVSQTVCSPYWCLVLCLYVVFHIIYLLTYITKVHIASQKLSQKVLQLEKRLRFLEATKLVVNRPSFGMDDEQTHHSHRKARNQLSDWENYCKQPASTNQVFAASTNQQLAVTTNQVMAASTNQVMAASTNQVMAASTNQVLAASTNQVVAASTSQAQIDLSSESMPSASTDSFNELEKNRSHSGKAKRKNGKSRLKLSGNYKKSGLNKKLRVLAYVCKKCFTSYNNRSTGIDSPTLMKQLYTNLRARVRTILLKNKKRQKEAAKANMDQRAGSYNDGGSSFYEAPAGGRHQPQQIGVRPQQAVFRPQPSVFGSRQAGVRPQQQQVRCSYHTQWLVMLLVQMDPVGEWFIHFYLWFLMYAHRMQRRQMDYQRSMPVRSETNLLMRIYMTEAPLDESGSPRQEAENTDESEPEEDFHQALGALEDMMGSVLFPDRFDPGRLRVGVTRYAVIGRRRRGEQIRRFRIPVNLEGIPEEVLRRELTDYFIPHDRLPQHRRQSL